MATRATPAKKPASRSGNPATAAAAKRAEEARARQDQEEREAAAAAVREQFASLKLDAPVLDDEGYEIIPDPGGKDGGMYKFRVKGQAFTLPNLQYLPLGIAQQLGSLTEAQAQSLIFGRYCPELLDVASAAELMHVMKRWQDFSKGISLGE